jgi:hypothetical protein
MESQEMEKKLNKEEYDKWTKFRSVKSSTITIKEQELIATLHSKYFAHTFYKPCNCNGGKTWKKWIEDLNKLYADGYREDS